MHPRSTCPDSEETMKHPLVSERTAGSRTGQWKRLRDGRRNSLLVSDCENCELCRYINNDVWGKNPFVLAFASSYWRIGGWHRTYVIVSVIALHLHAYSGELEQFDVKGPSSLCPVGGRIRPKHVSTRLFDTITSGNTIQFLIRYSINACKILPT